ncbi:MAG: hypothetical protein M3093_04070 [Thermoproteota archaeon]|nr:hypothetical protein [Thermoproteota archaeon]
MRAPFKGDDYFCKQINAATERVQEAFLDTIKPSITLRQQNAMLGDGTITQAETFDLENVQSLFRCLATALEDWTFSGILESATEDVHRIYATFTKENGKFYMTVYFGIQFHVLLYYKVDRQVIDIQKELMRMEETAASVSDNMTRAADKVLATELEKRGFTKLGFDELFARMFEDETLLEQLNEKTAVVEDRFPEFRDFRAKKTELLSKLRDLLIEFHRTSPLLIDYNKLMQGEEGVTNYFDIEILKYKKTKRREAFLDTAKITEDSTDMLAREIEAVEETLRKIKY